MGTLFTVTLKSVSPEVECPFFMSRDFVGDSYMLVAVMNEKPVVKEALGRRAMVLWMYACILSFGLYI